MRKRYLVPEWMDDPKIAPDLHRQALSGLKRINRISGITKRIGRNVLKIINTSPAIGAAASQSHAPKHLRILDIASGGGDVTHDVYQYLVHQGISCEVVGWDLSPTAVDFSNQRFADSENGSSLSFEQHDALRGLAGHLDPVPFDVIYCSLFLHHLPADQATELLRLMKERAMIGFIVDDLLRTRVGYWLAKIGSHLLSRSPVVHFDGPQSVRAAFNRKELSQIASDAGLNGVSITRHWPERFTLIQQSNSAERGL